MLSRDLRDDPDLREEGFYRVPKSAIKFLHSSGGVENNSALCLIFEERKGWRQCWWQESRRAGVRLAFQCSDRDRVYAAEPVAGDNRTVRRDGDGVHWSIECQTTRLGSTRDIPDPDRMIDAARNYVPVWQHRNAFNPAGMPI